MLQNEAKAVMISRQLNQEQKNQLLVWVRLAYAAEHSVRKLHGLDIAPGGIGTRKPQESSCSDIFQRSEE
ncbi:MAG: hypothetical protein FWB99_13355 [Treponema sp.]|nr:hypothetical protein [Treponema sp.]